MNSTKQLLCPSCKCKTLIKLRHDTALTNFPLFCSECKNETLIDVRQFQTFIIVEREPSAYSQLIYKNMTLSLMQRSVYIGNVLLRLTRQEFNLLYYLMLNKGIVITYEQIGVAVWGVERDSSTYHSIKNLVQRLRAKITTAGGGSAIIQNMRGVGYFLPVTHE